MKYATGVELILSKEGIIIAKCGKCNFQASARTGETVLEEIKDHMEIHK